MKTRNREVAVKPHQMDRSMLLPQSLNGLIPERHLIGVVNDDVESIARSHSLKDTRAAAQAVIIPR
jgi:hypothetical protein